MIKRLNHNKYQVPYREPEWPENPSKEQSLFSGRPPLRKMIVMVDADVLEPAKNKISGKTKLNESITLKSLLDHEFVQSYKYADDGPPQQEKPIKLPENLGSFGPVYKGWAVVGKYNQGSWPVAFSESGETVTQGAVRSNAPQIAREQAETSVEDSFSPEQREKDVLSLYVASGALQADLFVTERPYLHSGSKITSVSGLTVCTSREAIAVIALYLRIQQEFVLPPSSAVIKYSFDKELFFWVGMRELLPEAWRWFSACVQYSSATDNRDLMLLGGSLLSRVSRALRERDNVHVALNMVPVRSDDALGSLDNVLMLLMGAVDVSARVANEVLGLNFKGWQAGWQKEGKNGKSGWLDEVAQKSPALANVITNDRPGCKAFTILRLLRNNVHGIALQGVTYSHDGKDEMLVGIPTSDEEEILHCMDGLGGRESWGIQSILPQGVYIDPGILTDKLFEETIKLLNDLMRETQVENLSHVKITADNKVPPKKSESAMDTFSEWNRCAIRMQLGF